MGYWENIFNSAVGAFGGGMNLPGADGRTPNYNPNAAAIPNQPYGGGIGGQPSGGSGKDWLNPLLALGSIGANIYGTTQASKAVNQANQRVTDQQNRLTAESAEEKARRDQMIQMLMPMLARDMKNPSLMKGMIGQGSPLGIGQQSTLQTPGTAPPQQGNSMVGSIGKNIAGAVIPGIAKGVMTGVMTGGAAGGGAGAGAGAAGTGAGSGVLGQAGAWLASNPVTAGVAGALIAGAAILKSQAHWEANDAVQNFENPFHEKYLAPFVAEYTKAAPQMTPEQKNAARQQFQQNWNDYVARINQWAGNSSDKRKVAAQSIQNLSPTVQKIYADIQ